MRKFCKLAMYFTAEYDAVTLRYYVVATISGTRFTAPNNFDTHEQADLYIQSLIQGGE